MESMEMQTQAITVSDEDLMAQFQKLCEDDAKRDSEYQVDTCNELDWYSLSVGFFIAKGATADQAKQLAVTARYTHQYWQ